MTSPTGLQPEKRPRLGNGPQVANPCESGSAAVNAPELDRIRQSNTQLAYLQAQLAATEALCSAYEDELDALSEQLIDAKSSLLQRGHSLWKEQVQPVTLRKRRLEPGATADGAEDDDNDDVDTYSDIELDVLLTDVPEPQAAVHHAAASSQPPSGQQPAAAAEAQGSEAAAASTAAVQADVNGGAPGSAAASSPPGQDQQQQPPRSPSAGPGPGGEAEAAGSAGAGEEAGRSGRGGEGLDAGAVAAAAAAAAAAGARVAWLEALEATCSAVAQEDMEAQGAVACLCGRTGKYYLRGTVVTLGRSTETKGEVDVDLTPEEAAATRPPNQAAAPGATAAAPAATTAAAPAAAAAGGADAGAMELAAATAAASAAGSGSGGGVGTSGTGHGVSRRQALVRLGPDGQFRLVNMGRQPVLVNNVAVEQHHTVTLPHLSLMEVGGVRLLFMANLAAVARVVRRSAALVL